MIHFHIVTLFPEFFASPLAAGLLGRASRAGLVKFSFHNPRDFSHNKHRHVDDRPFGGGAGMVMRLEPLVDALHSIQTPGKILLLSPAGQQFDQKCAATFAREEHITLICGRYEGIDARLGEIFPLGELSLCPAVLNGGETAALAVAEAVSRLIPGFLGKSESASEESFSSGLLEYPQYTRPEEFSGHRAPQVLLGGNHARIALWRRQQSLLRTLGQNPGLMASAYLTRNDVEYMASMPRLRLGRNISFCLCHAPVRLADGKVGVSSLTNLDIHDIARISQSYKMGPFFILTPLQDQQRMLREILRHWLAPDSGASHADRRDALKKVVAVENYEQLGERAERYYGARPEYILTSAAWPDREDKKPVLPVAEIRGIAASRPVIILLGTARGLAPEFLPVPHQRLRPLRFLDPNHLSVRSAAAITADRILGDYD